ncbi:MAG: PQQ-binding-like beta-propeller repeat protein [Rubellimicrobium sp.]|nr:PQQ-binding-like beta-propeller repeat protein [Rubellimicrobium sp.]
MSLRLALAVLATVSLLVACGDRNPPLPGQRLPLRDGLASATAAQANRAAPVPLPAASVNADWTQRGGNAAHQLAHPALGPALQPVFFTAIGEGDSRRARITAEPVVAGGRVFAMDARAIVSALAPTGALLWQVDLTPPNARREDASGGGLASDGRVLYVTTGYGRIHALDAATGAERWVQDVNAPAGAAPTISGNLLYVVSRDSRAWALDTATGRIRWQMGGTPAVSTYAAGGAGVAMAPGMAIVPFPSGEVRGVFPDGGLQRWAQVVAGSRPGQSGGISATDIAGGPVVVGNTAYVANAGGRMAAIDTTTGDRRWSAGEGSTGGLWVAGGSVFVVNDVNELVRLQAGDGQVVWRVALPLWTRPEHRQRSERFVQYGPILAGGRLIVASSDGVLRQFDPASGALLGEVALPDGAASAPVVAGGVLYVLLKNGVLAAFR